MTLDKAIKITAAYIDDPLITNKYDFIDAIKLLIEAGKFVKSSRDPDGVPPYTLLPGEDPK